MADQNNDGEAFVPAGAECKRVSGEGKFTGEYPSPRLGGLLESSA